MAASERIFKLLIRRPPLPPARAAARARGRRIEFDGVWFAYKDRDW